MTLRDRNRAARLLSFYLEQVYNAAGLQWTSDNDMEVEDIIDSILLAARDDDGGS